MGMDVYGRNPKNEKGEYFRNNVWWWSPLWEFCCDVDPTLQKRVPRGWFNDGDGLKTQTACTALAKKLRHSIESGYAEFFIGQFEFEKNDIALENCSYCKEQPANDCSCCGGTGKAKPIQSSYRINLENINKFVDFLENCGGFEIW